jgi:NAD+ synthase
MSIVNEYRPELIDYQHIYECIEFQWKAWALETNTTKFVIGISGGKDSSVVAALASRIFGRDNVFGVLMPCGDQPDYNDAVELCEFLGIRYITVPIEDGVSKIENSIQKEFFDNNISYTETSRINLPARVRMTTLYAIAQSVGGKVINTCNLSEDCMGYSTLFGDDCGSYAPLKNLTCTEVKYLGKWLGLPINLYTKAPSDGLCGKSDEENFGFSYFILDTIIRTGNCSNYQIFNKAFQRYNKNKFKTKIVNLPSPNFSFYSKDNNKLSYYSNYFEIMDKSYELKI